MINMSKESRNSSSHSSTDGNRRIGSQTSNINSNTYTTLGYTTSSSAMSSFTFVTTCPSASSKGAMTVEIDKMDIPSTGGTSSFDLCSSQNTIKRKRKFSINSDGKNSEFRFGPPSAKRHQRVHSYYAEELNPIVPLAYPSLADDLVNESDTHSSSDCLSAVTEFDMTSDHIPDSPNSLHAKDDSATISPQASSSSKYSHIIRSYKHFHHLEATTYRERQDAHQTISNTNEAVEKIGKSFYDYASLHCCMTPASDTDSTRMCPLPAFSWANAQDVWQFMCKKDEEAACFRDSMMLKQHPGLKPRMRAILLDWLIEVCEVYKLHRETYYLAVDYLDRYLRTHKKVQKTHLQLIGITCLFIAAKVEEIYPPKISEFAYVTDGACSEENILQHEILVLQELNWSISPVTVMSWLGIYMQLNVKNRTSALLSSNIRISRKRNQVTSSVLMEEQNNILKNCVRQVGCSSTLPTTTTLKGVLSGEKTEPETNDAFIYPQFSGMEFVHTSQLLDLCSLDVSIGNYPYSILAASAISHTFNRETALRCSGLDWKCIEQCARWMEPFFQAVCEESDHLHLIEHVDLLPSEYSISHICPNILLDDSHIIQTHTTTMTMFDRACLIQEQQHKYLASKNILEATSPGMGIPCPEGLLTPPASSRKPFGADDELDQAE